MIACGGVAIGLVVAAALTRSLTGMVFGITTLDATTHVGVAAASRSSTPQTIDFGN